MSNPDVARMSTLQWLFEYQSLRLLEREQEDRWLRGLKHLLVNLLGLNLGPVRDKDGHIVPDPTEEQLERHYRPLVLWTGRDHALAKLAEDLESARALREGLSTSDKEYEERVAAGPQSLDDILPMPQEELMKLLRDHPVPEPAGVVDEPPPRRRVVVDDDE